MRVKWNWAFTTVAVLVVLGVTGCGRRVAQQPPKPPKQAVAVPLPEWAPKDPSPEFLRAARVLKPLPSEALTLEGGERSDLVSGLTQANLARLQAESFPLAYEFFGQLTDAQIATFEKRNEVRIRYRALTAHQRAALEKWMDKIREIFGEEADFKVILYKTGVREDFSDLDVGFASKGHTVGLYFWPNRPENPKMAISNDFAQY